MGRVAMVIKRIAHDRKRLSCFNKRQPGLIKKAMELSILCGAEVTLLITSESGKTYGYSTRELEDVVGAYVAAGGTVLRNDDYETQFGTKAGGKMTLSDDDDGGGGGGGGVDEDDDDEETTGKKRKPTAVASSSSSTRGSSKRTLTKANKGAAASLVAVGSSPSEVKKGRRGGSEEGGDTSSGAIINQFAHAPPDSSSGGSLFTPSIDGGSMLGALPTPSWNTELESILADSAAATAAQAGNNDNGKGSGGAAATDTGSSLTTLSSSASLTGAVVQGGRRSLSSSNSNSKRKKGPSVQLSVHTSAPIPSVSGSGGGGGGAISNTFLEPTPRTNGAATPGFSLPTPMQGLGTPTFMTPISPGTNGYALWPPMLSPTASSALPWQLSPRESDFPATPGATGSQGANPA